MVTNERIPTAGSIKLFGQELSEETTRMIGFVPQKDCLIDLLTLREHLELFCRIKCVPEHRIPGVVEAKIKETNLSEYVSNPSFSLSGGNKRKLCVAIATIGSPQLLVLDEPSSFVDPISKRSMWAMFYRMTLEGKSFILTSHSMEEVEALCDRICIISNGALVALGSAQHLKEKFGKGYEANISVRLPQPAELSTALRQLVAVGLVPAPVLPPSLSEAQTHEAEVAYLSSVRLVAGSLLPVAEALGDAARAQEVAAGASGAALWQAMQVDGSITLRAFLEWWVGETHARVMSAFVSSSFQATLLERPSPNAFRYRLSSEGLSLGEAFSRFETNKAAAFVVDYSLGLTSLEQVFNTLSAGQVPEAN